MRGQLESPHFSQEIRVGHLFENGFLDFFPFQETTIHIITKGDIQESQPSKHADLKRGEYLLIVPLKGYACYANLCVCVR